MFAVLKICYIINKYVVFDIVLLNNIPYCVRLCCTPFNLSVKLWRLVKQNFYKRDTCDAADPDFHVVCVFVVPLCYKN